MQLISMEVNQLGSADRTKVGTLQPGLNAVCGRRGSGKSSLIRWLRSMICPATNFSLSNSSSSDYAAGRLDLRLGAGDYQIERHERSGRTDSKVLRRATHAWNDFSNTSASADANALSPLQRDAFDRLTAIASDINACPRLWDVARDLKLDDVAVGRFAGERQSLEARESELNRELALLEGLSATRESLIDRRRQLETELDRLRRDTQARRYTPENDEHRRLSDRLNAIERDSQKLRDEIAEIDAAMARVREGHTLSDDPLASAKQERTYRERLLSLDAQLARWRHTLTEIRSHRERLEACATDAQLDGQLGEQFSPVNQATPRLALRSLEAQILEARRHFDALLDGVDRYRNDVEEARHELPQALRLMQRELHEVCQQLSRHESLTANRAMKDQILQLSRCETEMRQAIERLIAERGELLRTIANACHMSVDQVSVAYSDSCRCADHPQLDSWLTAVSAGGHIVPDAHDTARQLRQVDDLARLEARRTHALASLDACQRDYRETDAKLRRMGGLPTTYSAPLDRSEADMVAELDRIADELRRIEGRDRLRVELSDVRRRLQNLPRESHDAASLRGRYQFHLSTLIGRNRELNAHAPSWNGTSHWMPYSAHGFAHRDEHAPSGNGHTRWDFLSGQRVAAVVDPSMHDLEQGKGLAQELALRLAIAEVLSNRGHATPILLDQTLDHIGEPERVTAVRHLAQAAEQSKLQIVLMTEEQGVADAVRAARGAIVPIALSKAVNHERQVQPDVNRELSGFANDFEADKWSDPSPVFAVARTEVKKRFRLTERSDIEDVPSIGAVTGARLRAIGLPRVGDLLSADAQWIVDHAHMDGLTVQTVEAWQSEARLLCAMPSLRPFDARVLAGAGIRDHHQLESTEPSQLLARVEQFLVTDRGRQIMRTGRPEELSRITAWISSAKQGARERVGADHGPAFGIDPTNRSSRSQRDPADRAKTYQMVDRAHTEPVRTRTDLNHDDRKRVRRERTDRPARPVAAKPAKANRSDNGRRFYLELNSAVVDAPSIGPSMADKLEVIGIVSVSDLLSANPEQVAKNLNLSKVTSNLVRDWQDQARLVVRVPNLRGHDAQILVACGIRSPEALARIDANSLLNKASSFCASPQGQRVLRGGDAPDMAEVQDWIQWASDSRNVIAA